MLILFSCAVFSFEGAKSWAVGVTPNNLLTTINVPSDVPPGEGNLNNAIQTAISDGTLSNTVFQLEAGGYYILSATIAVPAGQHLTIVAPDPGTTKATAPPRIVWTSNGGVDTTFNFDCFGDISLKNIWLLYANTNGAQIMSSLQIEDNAEANASGKGEVGEFDGVIFDYSRAPKNGSGAVGITAQHFKGTFKNCYFRNCTDTHLRYYGRAVSFPYNTTGWHTDSVSFENCTFANLGYVYMQESNEYGDYVSFNHCTFLNTMMVTLESGYWYWLSVTNSIFVNAYMYGDIPTERWGTNPPSPFGGTINIDSISTFGFNVPFTEANRHILFANNSYSVEPWLLDWYANNPYSDTASVDKKPLPQPMMSEKTRAFFHNKATWPYISMADLYDVTNPDFVLAPTNIDAIKDFLLRKWTDNTNNNWAYNPNADIDGVWPMNEDLSYTNTTLNTAGMGGFPLGDLYHWQPPQYTTWKAQEATENGVISQWLNNGIIEINSAPAAPQNLAATAGNGQVTLRWNKNTEADFLCYRIYGSTTSPASTLIGSTSQLLDTVKAIAGLINGTKYYFRITAVDSAGNWDGYSNEVSATPSVLTAQKEYNPDANTVLLLHMNETGGSTVSDASGNALGGTIVNTATWQSGRFGNALNFSNQGYVSVPHNDLLNLQDVTLEMWIYPTMPSLVMTGADAAMALISKRTYNSAEPYTLVIRDNGALSLDAYYSASGSYQNRGTALPVIALNKWQHVAVTRSIVSGQVTIKLFVNGSQVYSTVENLGNALTNSQELWISRDGYYSFLTNEGTYQGLMDEIRISNMARSPQEFNLQLPPTNLSATSASYAISLLWQNGGGAVPLMRYRIYRGTDSMNVTLIDSTTATNYVNPGLLPGTYYFRVSAVDSTGFESAKSYAAGSTVIVGSVFTPTQNNLGITSPVGFAGFAWGDYDGDGDLDLFVPRGDQPSVLYRNDGGTQFVDVSATGVLADGTGNHANGAIWGDFDGDGDLDLVFADDGLKLYRNDGSLFTDVSAESQLINIDPGQQLLQAAAGDYDKDGDMDVVSAGATGMALPMRILRNDNGKFTDVANAVVSPSVPSLESWNPTWVDIDNDGDLDLWMPTIRATSQGCKLLLNQGGTFVVADSNITGIKARSAIASTWGDFDNDGDMDLFLIPYTGDNDGVAKFYKNNGNGTFTDIAHSLGLDVSFNDSRGVCWGDYDNDGDQDLLMGRMFNPQRLYRNDGGTFVEVGIETGAGIVGRSSRSVTFVDYDTDGSLDLFCAGSSQPNWLLHNGGNSNHWIGIKPRGTTSNTAGIGARIRVVAGSLKQSRDVQAGAGGITNGYLWPHFGLGSATRVDSVIVQWPNGAVTVAVNVQADRYLTFREEDILRLAPFAVSGQYLNEQIASDTLANGKLPNRVYVLNRGGIYLANASVTTPHNWTLRIRANDSVTTAKPIVMLYPTGSGANPAYPPGNLFSLQGNLEIRNLLITGYYEPVDTNLRNLQGQLILLPTTGTGVSVLIDSCILSNTNGNHIRTEGAPSVIRITNTVFANMGYLGRGSLGGGKAIDLRANSIDSLIIQNCTFINWQERIIRHLNIPNYTDPTGPIGYLKFDHNTLVNGMSYHGMLSLGSLGGKATITNNLFINPFSLGNDTDATRQLEFAPSGEKDPYGGNRMTWIFSIPDLTTQWTISNNYYCVSDSGQAFYNQFASAGVTGEGSPLTWHINGRLGSDSTNAFKKIIISPSKVPNLMTKLMRWYRSPSGGNKTKNTPGAWVYGDVNVHPYADPYDYDRKGYQWLQDSVNCSYYASETPVSTDGKAVGDPRWSFLGKRVWISNHGSAYLKNSNWIQAWDAYPVNPAANKSAYDITGNAMTVEAWIFLISVPRVGQVDQIVARRNGGTSPIRGYWFGIRNVGPSDDPRIVFKVGNGADTAIVSDIAPAATGVWKHVAVTYDGSQVKLYVDGVLASSAPYSQSLVAGSDGFYVGSSFHGLLDEVRLWDIARTQEQLQTYMESTVLGTEPGLRGYWPLDEATTVNGIFPVTVDRTANHNDLRVNRDVEFIMTIPRETVALAPEFPPSGPLAGVANVPFAFAPFVSGWPTPSVSYVYGPSGMTFDPVTDSVRWTPSSTQTGFNNVGFRATNSVRTVDTIYSVWVDPYTTEFKAHNDNNTVLYVGNNGMLGRDSVTTGFQFNGLNGLYEAAVVIGKSTSQVSGTLYFREFGIQSTVQPITSYLNGFDQAFESRFNDQRSGNPIGVSVIQRSHSKSTAPDRNYVVLDYEIANTSGSDLTGLYVGLAADLDVGSANNDRAGYDDSRKLSYVYEATGGTNPNYYGITPLNSTVSGHAAWINGAESDSANSALYQRMTTFGTIPPQTADFRSIIGTGPHAIPAGRSLRVMFAIVAGTTLTDLQATADVAHAVQFKPQATILSVRDVPNDQGGHVTIRWSASMLDDQIHNLPSYSIWRAIPEAMQSMLAKASAVDVVDSKTGRRSTLMGIVPKQVQANVVEGPGKARTRVTVFNGVDYAWEWIGDQPAHRFVTYSYTASTLYDSMSTTNGQHYFLVSAQTSDPYVYYDSNVDSGHSVDNLSPASPGWLSAELFENPSAHSSTLKNTKSLRSVLEITSSGVKLTWEKNRTDQDVGDCVIYRSTINGFEIGDSTRLATCVDTTYTDLSLPNAAAIYYRVTTRDIHGNESAPSPQAEVFCEPTRVASRVFLEGPYLGSGSMRTSLRGAGIIPTAQPYNTAPWNYAGTESVSSIPEGVVDWVLVQLRAGPTTTVATRAAFLKNDGSIVDLNGTSAVGFGGISAGNYYIIIRHRNHLGVMSANAVALSSSSSLYDFTDWSGGQRAYGDATAMINLGGGKYAMYAGDATADGQVNASDRSSVDNGLNLTGDYMKPDVSLDGQVNATDRTWVDNNLNRVSQVP